MQFYLSLIFAMLLFFVSQVIFVLRMWGIFDSLIKFSFVSVLYCKQCEKVDFMAVLLINVGGLTF